MLDIFDLKYEELPHGYEYEFFYPESWWEVQVIAWSIVFEQKELERNMHTWT